MVKDVHLGNIGWWKYNHLTIPNPLPLQSPSPRGRSRRLWLPFESSCDRLHHKIVTIYSNNITERSNKVRWYILGDIFIYITMKQQLKQVQSDARKINSAHAYSSVRVYQLIEGHIRHSTITQLLRNSISFATPLQRLLNIILIFKA